MKFVDYKCLNKKCGIVFTKRIEYGITPPRIVKCAMCRKKARKVYSPVGIAFKGSGFYVNDYKKGE